LVRERPLSLPDGHIGDLNRVLDFVSTAFGVPCGELVAQNLSEPARCDFPELRFGIRGHGCPAVAAHYY
jgi:hypothetical protein